MTEDRHIIWSNYALNYDDWKADLEAAYPDLTEDERIALMYEINGDYLDDERVVHRRRQIMAPGEMEEVVLKKSMFASHPDLKRIFIKVEEA